MSVSLYLGAQRPLDNSRGSHALRLPAHHLVTHGVVVGMTGSGKTGLVTVLIEEALRNRVPVLVVDVKGDLTNLLLAFPSFDADHIVPWVSSVKAATDARSAEEIATSIAEERQRVLNGWRIDAATLASYDRGIDVRVVTPGSSAGEPLHVLSSLERRSKRWEADPESARAALSAAVSLLLRLLGRDPDPARSKEHVLLSLLAESRLAKGADSDLTSLLKDLAEPPVTHVGALELDAFISRNERRALSAALNTLLASPTFAGWRQGATMDVDAWLTPVANGRTPAVVVSVAHLDDEERALVLGVLLEEVLSWVRSLPGTQSLRALVVFDEVFGFLPPHPANPPTKRPLVALMKQARAFGVGVVVATQNPMDLDYRALSNAGLWCIGRLQTDADRTRVIDGLAQAGQGIRSSGGLANLLKRLAPRWFLMRDTHSANGTMLMQPRCTMSFLRGPMTRAEIRAALDARQRTSDVVDADQDAAEGRVPLRTEGGRRNGHELALHTEE